MRIRQEATSARKVMAARTGGNIVGERIISAPCMKDSKSGTRN